MKLIRVLSALGVFICFVLWVSSALASRNSSGTMAGINGPYVAGTVISSSVINARLADIETELTDSASRSGKGGFTAPVRGADGTVTAPTFAFTSETGTGLYRIGSSDLGLSINQSKVGEWTANGYRSGNGAVATPSLSFFNDTGSGLYRAGSNDIRMAINGADATQWTASGASVTGWARVGNGAVGAPSYSFTNDATAGLYRAGSGDIRLAIGGADLVQAVANMLNVSGGVNPRSNASPFPSTGKGLELVYSSVGDNGAIQSYDRTGAAWKALSIDSSAITVNATSAGTFKIGTGGTTTSQLNFGSCTSSGGTPSNCTATVVSGAKCVASLVSATANTLDQPVVSVTTTTLTITNRSGTAATFNYVCF